MKQELVEQWMSKEVVATTADAALSEAQELMRRHKIRRLPVLEDGRLVGIITRGDIAAVTRQPLAKVVLPDALDVAALMSTDLVTISPQATLDEAARLLVDNGIGGLPVVDDQGRLVGIITEADIYRLAIRRWQSQ